MSIATITFIIVAFCGIKDPKISEKEKLDCMDYMVNNCIVDGTSTNKLMDQCREEYIAGRRYRD